MKSFKQYVAEKVRGRKTKEIAGKDAAYMPGKSKQEIATARHYAAKKAGVSSFDAAGMTLAELEQKVAQVKSKRKRDWEKFEKDVAAGIDNLFKTGFFTVVKDGKATKIEGQSGFSAQQAGGPKQADVKVTHRLSDGTERSFYVECKYNYASANYFKFQVEVENGRFRYDPKFFEAGCSDEEKEEVRKLFAEIDLTGFFEELVQDDRVRSSWEFFQRQIKDIATFLKHDDKWKDFAEGLKQQYVFPRDLPAMANVFDLYVDVHVSDDLRKMGLKIFAKEPDFDGKKYSFVESDANYVGKRHRPVFVKLG